MTKKKKKNNIKKTTTGVLAVGLSVAGAYAITGGDNQAQASNAGEGKIKPNNFVNANDLEKQKQEQVKVNKETKQIKQELQKEGFKNTVKNVEVNTPTEVAKVQKQENVELKTTLDKYQKDKANAQQKEKEHQDYLKAQVKYKEDLANYNKKTAEQDALFKKNQEELKQAKAAEEKYKQELAVHNQKVENNKKKQEAYNQATKKYQEEAAAHNQKMKELEQKTNQTGYLSQAAAQDLIFKSESQANARISGEYMAYNGTNASSSSSDYEFTRNGTPRLQTNYETTVGDNYVIKNIPNRNVSVTYDNLSNTYFKGDKISKIVYTYNSGQEFLMRIAKDPTRTVFLHTLAKDHPYIQNGTISRDSLKMNMNVKFYYQNGQQASFENSSALISLASLNSYGSSVGGEYVTMSDRNMTPIKINGSSVEYNSRTKTFFSPTNNNADYKSWDVHGSGREYYGAGVAKVHSGNEINLTFGNNSYNGGQWFTFNADVKSVTAPPTPIKPGLPPLEDTSKPPVAPKKVLPFVRDNIPQPIKPVEKAKPGAVNKPTVEYKNITVKDHIERKNLNHGEKYVNTDKLFLNEARVVQNGKNGEEIKTTKYSINKDTGLVEQNTTTTVNKPVDKIIEIGTKVPDIILKAKDGTILSRITVPKTGISKKTTTPQTNTSNSRSKRDLSTPPVETPTDAVSIEKEININTYMPPAPDKVENYTTPVYEGRDKDKNWVFTVDKIKTIYSGDPTLERGKQKEEDNGYTTGVKKVKVGTMPKIEKENIPFITKYKANEKLDRGQQVIDREGKTGLRTTTTTYTVNENTGVLIPQKPTVTTDNPIDKIVSVGNKPKVEVETIPFKEIIKVNPELKKGTVKVVREGMIGKTTKTTTYKVDEITGKVTENTPTVQTLKAIDRIIETGSKIITTYEGDPSKPVGTEEIVKTGENDGNRVIKRGLQPKVEKTNKDLVVKYIPDETMKPGEQKVEKEGKNGFTTTTTTYKINKETGEVTPNTPTSVETKGEDRVVRVGIKPNVTTKDKKIPVRYVTDDTLEVGKQVVEKEGKAGNTKTTITFSIDEKTGQVKENKPVIEETNSEERVIKVGIKPNVTTKDKEIPVRYVTDDTLEAGKQVVEKEGKAGKIKTTITFSVDEKTGQVKENKPVIEETNSEERVIKVGVKKKVEEIKVPFKTIKKNNPNLPEGEQKVVKKGKEGKTITTTTYTVDPKTGELKENKKTETVQSEDEIIEVGTKKAEKPVAPEKPVLPVLQETPKKELPKTSSDKNSLVLPSLAMTAAAGGMALAMARKRKRKQI